MEPAEHHRPHPADSLQAGDLVGRYQLLCPIARGGMGAVWAARQTGRLALPGPIAIKIALPYDKLSYDSIQELLYDEARVTASIDHPNVCKVIELGQEGEMLFIAMEWIYGVSLATLLAALPGRRLDVRIAAQLVAAACSGLHSAHELKDEAGQPLDVVHRDATPQNLMISATGDLKIVDFGIVKSRNQVHEATQTGELKGKISYLAPEQVRGKDVDRRTDVFTLGCVLYLATTGRGPFNGDAAGTTIMRIMAGEYTPPASLVPTYPDALSRIVARALATDPAERFQSAEDMRAALEAFLDDGSRPISREDVALLVNKHCGYLIERCRTRIRAAQRVFVSSGTFPALGLPPAGEVMAEPASTTSPVELVLPSGEPYPLSGPLKPPFLSRPLARIGLGVSAAAVLAVLVASALSAALGSGAAVEAPAATQAKITAPEPVAPAPPAPERVEIVVRASPAGALVSIDDGPAVPTPHSFLIARDGHPRVFRLSAPDHEELAESRLIDRSASLFFELRPLRSARATPPRPTRVVRSAKPAAEPRPNAAAPERAAPPRAQEASPQPNHFPTLPRHAPRRIDEADPFGETP